MRESAAEPTSTDEDDADASASRVASQERVTASLGSEDDSLDDGEVPTPTAVREGDILSGKYRVEGVIGGGGMGVVFAATHLQLTTKVALKVLRRDVDRRAVAVGRLLREARSNARIQGEHVVRVLDVGALDTGEPYLVMEHLTGRDLRAELRAGGPLAVEAAVEYVLQACEAVAQAHAAGIVHRDLKPSNLFLTRRTDGSPCLKVLDFGIAKAVDGDEAGDVATITHSRAVLGSPMYMSPEQIRSAKTVDQRTDVWALGIILFELITGTRPFEGASVGARLAATAADSPIPLRRKRPDAPAQLEKVILRCLEKDVARRMPSVVALVRALAPFASPRAAASIERVEGAVQGGRPLPARALRGSKVTLAGLMAVLLVGGAAAYRVRARRVQVPTLVAYDRATPGTGAASGEAPPPGPESSGLALDAAAATTPAATSSATAAVTASAPVLASPLPAHRAAAGTPQSSAAAPLGHKKDIFEDRN